jgi:hypothetical protein
MVVSFPQNIFIFPQFNSFLTFALTLVPFFGQSQAVNTKSVFTAAVANAVLDSRNFEEECHEYLLNSAQFGHQSASDPLERHLMQNLLLLVRWQEQSEQGAPLKHSG